MVVADGGRRDQAYPATFQQLACTFIYATYDQGICVFYVCGCELFGVKVGYVCYRLQDPFISLIIVTRY